MTKTLEQIQDGIVPMIDYTLTVEGEILDSSDEHGPLEYLHGQQNIVVGLEKALTGKKIGESLQVTIAPTEGYGEYDDEAVAFVPRIEMPPEVPLEVDTEFMIEDDDGAVMVASITWVGADEVKLDFNHALAGLTLEFDVKVVGLREATGEEIEHGHAHQDGHSHD
jgi:FKBP-type peptidyl-prolyl cis-trans isomerase SlyD